MQIVAGGGKAECGKRKGRKSSWHFAEFCMLQAALRNAKDETQKSWFQGRKDFLVAVVDVIEDV